MKKREADIAKRRQWSDYGYLSPVSKVIPDKKKQVNRRMCRYTVCYSFEL